MAVTAVTAASAASVDGPGWLSLFILAKFARLLQLGPIGMYLHGHMGGYFRLAKSFQNSCSSSADLSASTQSASGACSRCSCSPYAGLAASTQSASGACSCCSGRSTTGLPASAQPNPGVCSCC